MFVALIKQNDRFEHVACLVENGASVNKVDAKEHHARCFAASQVWTIFLIFRNQLIISNLPRTSQKKFVKIVEHLLKHGADPEFCTRTTVSWDPLDVTCWVQRKFGISFFLFLFFVLFRALALAPCLIMFVDFFVFVQGRLQRRKRSTANPFRC